MDARQMSPSIARRLLSMVYETLLVIGVLAVLLTPLFLLATINGQLLPAGLQRVYVFLGLAAYFLYQWHGGRQTLAMRTWKLKILASDGTIPPPWRLALRYVLAWPSIGGLGLGLLWALLDRDRQFLHDRLAGTRLIYAPPTKS